jgi:uncharacterized phage protein (TIGR01671 family)
MREILFRGKHQQNNEWVYGFYYLDCPHKNPRIIDGDRTVYVIPETVGQYTGVKDKNGVKIFEGDIVEWVWFECEGKRVEDVVFALGGFFLCNDSDSIGHYRDSLRVIGNIHDSPELLNAEVGAE